MAEARENAKNLCNIISKLPDEILQAILDKLPVADAVRTAFLSHRWRNLWKYISIIKFGSSWFKSTGKEIVSSLDQFISLHQGQKIKRFSVRFTYQPEMSTNVDEWIKFAINKNVEEILLDFDVKDGNISRNTANYPCYELLPSVFNCESLVSLTLNFCDIKLPPSIQLHSLKEVHLHRIELAECAIQILTSNTPVLGQLTLSNCNRTRDLHVHVTMNPHFYSLIIYEDLYGVNHTTRMVIKAPSARAMIFLGCMPRSNYHIEDLSRDVDVSFYLDQMFPYGKVGGDGQNILVSQRYEKVLQKLLAYFKEVSALHFCSWCIQILSLSEQRNFRRVTFDCTFLEVNTCFRKWDLPGIIYMLKACHMLEELVIETGPTDDEIKVPQDFVVQYDFQERSYLGNQMRTFKYRLQNLRIVEFKKTSGDYQTWAHGHFNLHHFFNGAKNGLDLLTLLRVSAMNLECILFTTNKQQHEINFLDK